MAIIERVRIEGFWGAKNLDLSLYPDINFIIGVNGSGKTTLIKLIAAVLNADFSTLDRLLFNKISLTLSDKPNRRKPIITVTKSLKDTSPFSDISFSIAESSSASPKLFRIAEIEEARHFRHLPPREFRRLALRKHADDIIEVLNELAPSSWLSIHRARGNVSREEQQFESSVDAKVSEISNNLARYFTELQNQANEKTNEFQQNMFLSLLSTDIKEEWSISQVKKYDLNKERQLLADIFQTFHIPPTRYQRLLEDHFNRLITSLKRIESSPIGLQDLIAPINMLQIHPLVQNWIRLTQEKDLIFFPKDNFLKVINDMLQRKKLSINDKNELVPIAESNATLRREDLSSGEKQLLIILGEALLQRGVPRIYIADEPELSLHIKWQQMLVSNLRKINPNAQIVFATHSPDIVSEYGDYVLDMEKILP